jgi:hypothetical protein
LDVFEALADGRQRLVGGRLLTAQFLDVLPHF